MELFYEDSMVTPLPCDIRHYFHTECIEEWLSYNKCCPLCKTPVTLEEIERVAKMYALKIQQANNIEQSQAEKEEVGYGQMASSKRSSATGFGNCASHSRMGPSFDYNKTLNSRHSNESGPSLIR